MKGNKDIKKLEKLLKKEGLTASQKRSIEEKIEAISEGKEVLK